MLKHVRDLPKLSQLVIDKLGDHTVQVLNSYMSIMHVTKSPGPSPNKSPASKTVVTTDVAPMTPGTPNSVLGSPRSPCIHEEEILEHESSEESSSLWEEITQREDGEVSEDNGKYLRLQHEYSKHYPEQKI